jgi:hypothetical protein
MNRKKPFIFIGLLIIFLSYLLLVLPNTANQSSFANDDVLAISTSGLYDHAGDKDDTKKFPFSIIEYAAASITAMIAAIFSQHVFPKYNRKMIFMTPIYYEANSI